MRPHKETGLNSFSNAINDGGGGGGGGGISSFLVGGVTGVGKFDQCKSIFPALINKADGSPLNTLLLAVTLCRWRRDKLRILCIMEKFI